MSAVRRGFLPATGTLECVKLGVGIPDADFGFEVPVFSKNPGISVGDTCTGGPSLVAVVFKAVEYGVLDAADVVLATYCMEAEEVSGPAVAEPIAYFGLYKPVFPTLAFGKFPCVEVA